MANEYLKRTPTSTGNRKVFTFSVWYKRLSDNGATDSRYFFLAGDTHINLRGSGASNPDNFVTNQRSAGTNYFYHYAPARRDYSSWQHLLYAVDTTQSIEKNRGRVYINGVEQLESSSIGSSNALQNDELSINKTVAHLISEDGGDDGTYSSSLQLFDAFLIDGQALTPDVFGFYKDGDGYQSSGTTQATEFRPGQWVPKSPSVIKNVINNSGGFGVNGFYLPMNDSSNPGADFHCDPNSIITLKGEDLPQPRNGAPTTSDAFVSQLRQEEGTLGFDGVVKFDGVNDYLSVGSAGDFNFLHDDTSSWTAEYFVYPKDEGTRQTIFSTGGNSSATGFCTRIMETGSTGGGNGYYVSAQTSKSSGGNYLYWDSNPKTLASNRWYHVALVYNNSNNTLKIYVDGELTNGSGTASESGSFGSHSTSNSSFALRVGEEPFGGGTLDASAVISNLRIVNNTTVYTSNFTAPTEPLTNITNTTLLCCQSITSATAATVTPGTITATGDVVSGKNEIVTCLVLAVPGISTATGATLITNGTFDSSDLSDWTTTDNTQSWNNGQLQINRSGGGGATSYQAFTTEAGKRYTVKGTVNSSGSRGDLRVYNGTGFGGTLLLNFSGTYGQTTTQTGSFTAASTTTSLGFSIDNNSTTIYVDNVVVKQEDVPRDYSADIKGSGTNKTLTPVGDAGVGYELGGYYGSAMTFDGTGDYITAPSSTDLQLGSGNFTIEAWVNYSSGNGADTPITLDNGTATFAPLIGYLGTNLGQPLFYLSSTGSSWDITGNGGLSFGSNVSANQWTHLAVVREGTNLSIYRDGVCANILNDLGTKSIYQGTNQVSLGRAQTTNLFDGQIQDVRIYKGLAKYKGGFDVPKPYTPVGFEGDSWRTTADTCKNNFATLNPLFPFHTDGVSYSDGNLFAQSSNNNKVVQANMAFTSGKWYWETRNYKDEMIGIGVAGGGIGHYPGTNTNALSYHFGGAVYDSGTSTGYGAGWAGQTYHVIGIAVDKDNDKVYWHVDGVWANSANPVSGTGGWSILSQNALKNADTHVAPSWRVRASSATEQVSVNFGQNPSFSGALTAGTFTDDSGKGLFKYAPPSGFLALCEDNLPTPTIADPGDYMRTVLYNGSGNSGRSITGVGFKPDFVWLKCKNVNRVHGLWDSVRGASKYLVSSGTSIEENDTTNGIQSFDGDGFSIGSVGTFNNSGDTYVAWCWKAGGAAVSNADGSITTQVSANQTAGFSIVSWTGNATEGATIGHGLGKAPGFIIVKNRDDSGSSGSTNGNWQVWHQSFTGQQYINLNSTNQMVTETGGVTPWGGTVPSSSVITLGSFNSTNGSSDSMIAYIWTEIEGFSKFGSYVGNNNADGSFVYCGFKPAWVMIRRTLGENWAIIDSSRSSSNPADLFLRADENVLETSAAAKMDFLSNGFKLRGTDTKSNGDGDTYIFMAFAESPFQTANAK